jgi:DNA-directed RNA polymerase beta subunit
MPFVSSTGMIPDAIVNTTGVYKRLVMGQLREGVDLQHRLETLPNHDNFVINCIEGGFADGSPPPPLKTNTILDGITGRVITTSGTLLPIFYTIQRQLPHEALHVTRRHEPQDFIPRGKASCGGAKYGPMELSTLEAQGGGYHLGIERFIQSNSIHQDAQHVLSKSGLTKQMSTFLSHINSSLVNVAVEAPTCTTKL